MWINWVRESQIFLKLLVTHDDVRSVEEILSAERKGVEVFQPNSNVNSSHEWPILEQFMGECVGPSDVSVSTNV